MSPVTDADQDAREKPADNTPTGGAEAASAAPGAAEKPEDTSDHSAGAQVENEHPPEDERAADSEGRERGLLIWVAAILLILGVELFIYGHNGRVEVCVGLEGVTDFSLVGQKRSPENFRKYPKCLERMNLGMWTSSEEVAREALNTICSRLTAKLEPEFKQQCIRKEGRFDRVVVKENIPPWDPRLYRQLLFLD